MKMVPQRGPGPPFWVPRVGGTSVLGLFGSHVAPQCPPGRFLEVFGTHLMGYFEPEIHDFRY